MNAFDQRAHLDARFYRGLGYGLTAAALIWGALLVVLYYVAY